MIGTQPTWVHSIACFLRAHQLHVVDGTWPGDDLPADCLEVAGRRLVVVPIPARWEDVEAVNVGQPRAWSMCFGAIAVSQQTAEIRVCSRSRKGWHDVRTLDARGMPQSSIAIPARLWSPIQTLVEYLHATSKDPR